VKTFSIFNVTAHHDLPDRGGFVLGTMCGEIRPGMSVRGAGSSRPYAVASVESLSGRDGHIQALIFRSRPALSEVAESFPIGSAVFFAGSGSGSAP
jgi:hypothetical protein